MRRLPATPWSMTFDDREVLPRGAAVGRPDRADAGASLVRHDHVPVRLRHRLPAEARRKALRRDGRPPREAAVRRRAHEDAVPEPVVVPLRVAVAVVRALRPRVAGDPVLVVEVGRAERRGDRALPGEASVGRSAREDRARRTERGQAHPERERRDHPDVVHRVIGDRRVADPRPGPALVDRRPGQHAGRPGAARVRRRRPADVARAASRVEPSGLEGGDHGVAEAERVGLDLSPVLARLVRVRVGADRGRDHASAGCGRGRYERDRDAGEYRPGPALPHDN